MQKDNPPLVYQKTWLTIGVGLVLVVIYLSLTPKPVKINLDIAYLDKFEHAFAYSVQTLWFSMIVFREKPRLLISGGLIAMGSILEILQGIGQYRYFQYSDMVANTVGVAMGYLLGLTSLRFGLWRFENRIAARARPR